MISVPERLKDLRTERKLKLEELAELTGLSKSALGSYETDDYKDISPFSIVTLAEYYGVSTDYLLGVSEMKNHPDTDLAGLHLSDEMLKLLASGKINNRLLCEIATHKDFQRLMVDTEICVDRIAAMRVHDMNAVLAEARKMVAEKYNPDENDLHMRTIEMAMQLDEESFFSHVMHEDLDAIVHDIREEHKTDSMTADEGNIPTADDIQKNIQMAMDGKTGAEFLAKQFCEAMQIPREKVSETEMMMLINLLEKSPQIKNMDNMRGKTKTPHGPGKRKRKR